MNSSIVIGHAREGVQPPVAAEYSHRPDGVEVLFNSYDIKMTGGYRNHTCEIGAL